MTDTHSDVAEVDLTDPAPVSDVAGDPAPVSDVAGDPARCLDVAGDPAPNPHATAEQVEAALKDSKLAQILYHDWEAETYDDKWSISYDKRCVDYARDLFDATVPAEDLRKLPYERALELGCGSGFFLLNLIQAGVARRGSVTDLSPGMVNVAVRNGASRWAWTSTAGSLTPRASPRRRHLRPGCRPRGAAPYPRRREVADRGDPGAQARWPVHLRRRTHDGRQRLRPEPVDADLEGGHQRHPPARSGGWRRPQAELDESSRAAALEAVVDVHLRPPLSWKDGPQRRSCRSIH